MRKNGHFRVFRNIRMINPTALYTSMKECMDSENLHKRLKKIAGQITAIDRMIDEDIPCEDILIQVNAVSSAIKKVSKIILVGHINHCVRDDIDNKKTDDVIVAFEKALDQYSKI